MRWIVLYLVLLVVTVESRGGQATLRERRSGMRDYYREYSYGSEFPQLSLSNLNVMVESIRASVDYFNKVKTHGQAATKGDPGDLTRKGRESCLRLAELSDEATPEVKKQVVSFLREQSKILYPSEREEMIRRGPDRDVYPPRWPDTITVAMCLAVAAWDTEKRGENLRGLWLSSHTDEMYDKRTMFSICAIVADLVSTADAAALAEMLVAASNEFLARKPVPPVKGDNIARTIGVMSGLVFRNKLVDAKDEQDAWLTLLRRFEKCDLEYLTGDYALFIIVAFKRAFLERFPEGPTADIVRGLLDHGSLKDRYLLCYAYVMAVDEKHLTLDDPVLKAARKVIADWPADAPLGDGTLKPCVERIVREKSGQSTEEDID